MAGDWIKMRKTLPADPRVVRMMSALKADRFRTLGGVLSAWCLLDDQTEDGRLEGYTPEVFDEVVGFPGLSRAMQSVGWLDIGDNYLAAPRFSEHNGKTAKRRAQDAVRKMSAREADKTRTDCGPEKRREEKSNIEITKVISCADHSDSAPQDGGFVFAMQTGPWRLPAAKLDEYQATYQFDVPGELRKASQWLRDNKDRRPRSPTGMKKFLTAWLNRKADKTPGSVPVAPRKKDKHLEWENLRSRLVKSWRASGASEDEIEQRCDAAKEKFFAAAVKV